MKRIVEMDFWRKEVELEGGALFNDHFALVFTDAFGLTADFYNGKRLLDVGCGPTGTLEWATMAAERVGLDPLVDRYRSLGIDKHQMKYVDAPSERMPFEDDYFDVVSSFNSLDHVDDIEKTVAEIVRVLKPGGSLLLLVEVNHPPTATEPITLPWDVTTWFGPRMTSVFERRFEVDPEAGIYRTVLGDRRWDDTRPDIRPGLLLARLDMETAPRPTDRLDLGTVKDG
jgi:SAM-dependent methyltransferase